MDCEGTFISGMQMIGVAGPNSDCPLHTTLVKLSVGECETGDCAPNADSCGDGFFTEESESCLISNTSYGSCTAKEPTCRFSPQECPSGSTVDWTFPHKDCSCENVVVGACQNKHTPDLFVCAVNAQACDDQSLWIPADQVPSQLGVQCFLCRELSNPIHEGVSKDISETQEESQTVSSPSDSLDTAVIGATVGASLFLLAVGWFVFWRSRRSRPSPTVKNKDATAKSGTPPEAVVIGRGYGEETMDESDNVSVL